MYGQVTVRQEDELVVRGFTCVTRSANPDPTPHSRSPASGVFTHPALCSGLPLASAPSLVWLIPPYIPINFTSTMSLQGLISGAECAVPFNPLSQVLKHTEGDRSVQMVCELLRLQCS